MIRRTYTSLRLATGSLAALAIAGLPFAALATAHKPNDMSSPQDYVAYLHPLNNSNVSGTVHFMHEGNKLVVDVHATGLEPGLHPQHIHGKLDGSEAECPTDSNDTNHDGYISVVEGAPAYGPIKLNLTSPQTPFGPPPTAALFAPFAGTPDSKNFPTAGADGVLNFHQSYSFDNSTAAQSALESLMPLGDQHYVVHGATAPLGVDADAFAALGAPRPAGYDPKALAYDVLLPVGCGQIEQAETGGMDNSNDNGSAQDDIQAFNDRTQQIFDEFETTVNKAQDSSADEVQSAHDTAMSQFNEARNLLMDKLSHNGQTSAEDQVMISSQAKVDQMNRDSEQAKADLNN